MIITTDIGNKIKSCISSGSSAVVYVVVLQTYYPKHIEKIAVKDLSENVERVC